jgi:hypothetical protein
MASSLPAPSLNDIIAFITDEVKRLYERTQQPVNGTRLAEAIRYKFPDFSFPAFGVERLADLVQLAEKQGLVIRNRAVKHLEVAPADAYPTAPSAPFQARPQRRAEGLIPREIWEAFLFFRPGQARFLDRQTRKVIAVSEAEAAPYANDARYVLIETVPADMQKSWMRNFVAEHPEVSAAAAAIESELWYREFFKQLQAIRRDLGSAWSKERARHVIQYVQQWAADHQVPLGDVLSPRLPGSKLSGLGPTPGVISPALPHVLEDAALRAAVLGTLGEMALDELLTLSVPLRHVVRHFRPR